LPNVRLWPGPARPAPTTCLLSLTNDVKPPSSAPRANPWNRFTDWVTSNRETASMWAGSGCDDPTLLVAPACFVVASSARPPLTSMAVSASLFPLVVASMAQTIHHRRGCFPSSKTRFGLRLYPIWAASSLDECFSNGVPLSSDHLHFFDWHFSAGWDESVELSYRLGIASLDRCGLISAPQVAAAPAVLLVYFRWARAPSHDGNAPFGISRHSSTSCWCSQAEHNVLNAPLSTMLGVHRWVPFRGPYSPPCTAHSSPVQLVREFTENRILPHTTATVGQGRRDVQHRGRPR